MNYKILQRSFDLESYLKSKDPEAKHSSGNMVVKCPVCEKQKLWVLLLDKADGTKAGVWQCWLCGDVGNSPLSLIKRIEDCSTFEALRIMSSLQNGRKPLVDFRSLIMEKLDGVVDTEEWKDTPITHVPLPDEFIPASDIPRLPEYFAVRRLNRRKVERYGLGFCEDGYFRNRLVIPVIQDKQQHFFVARYMKAKLPLGYKKTLYPKGAQPGRVLFNFDRARRCSTIRITEGALDAIAVGKTGVATFGTNLSQYQLELLMRTMATSITLAWDPDAVEKARKLAVRLSEFWQVRVLVLPNGKDPDEIPRSVFRKLEAEAEVLDPFTAFKECIREKLR